MLAKTISEKSRVNDRKSELNILWSALRNGDHDSLSKLFKVSHPVLFNYGYKMVPDEVFIKDSIQELFLRLWEKRATISEAKSVKAYLLSSLRRIILRRLEKRKHRMERNRWYQENIVPVVYNVEEVMIHSETDREKKSQLAMALQSLSKRQKEAVYLKFYDGLSNTEIAEVMGINIQSVYNHISEAVLEMQEYVEESGQSSKVARW
jgi:RNA polymerase sigma factor (sigma-70 family)